MVEVSTNGQWEDKTPPALVSAQFVVITIVWSAFHEICKDYPVPEAYSKVACWMSVN